ncbi:hypothetical protein D3C78_1494010 [compost metagenome]
MKTRSPELITPSAWLIRGRSGAKSHLRGPVRRNGHSHIGQRPHKYLIETNPALTKPNSTLGSNYLCGHAPGQAQKLLGVGLYE